MGQNGSFHDTARIARWARLRIQVSADSWRTSHHPIYDRSLQARPQNCDHTPASLAPLNLRLAGIETCKSEAGLCQQ